MKKNMGKADRIIRILLVIVVGALYFTGVINGTVAIVLGAFAVIFLLTSMVGVCPAYSLFKVSSCKRQELE